MGHGLLPSELIDLLPYWRQIVEVLAESRRGLKPTTLARMFKHITVAEYEDTWRGLWANRYVTYEDGRAKLGPRGWVVASHTTDLQIKMMDALIAGGPKHLDDLDAILTGPYRFLVKLAAYRAYHYNAPSRREKLVDRYRVQEAIRGAYTRKAGRTPEPPGPYCQTKEDYDRECRYGD